MRVSDAERLELLVTAIWLQEDGAAMARVGKRLEKLVREETVADIN